MALAVFNLNDAGVQVALDGELVRTSPGYAVLDNRKLMIGEAAARNSKLLPRWTNNRFWSQLNTNPLANGTDRVRHHADLAFAHLEELWVPISDQADEVILCVPGYYDQANLGLLLGMAKEAAMPVRGIVDHAVAAASGLALPPNALHLDIHLHGITLTKLSNSGLLVRRDVKTAVESGFVALWERWANIIANQFIQTIRFDPMHEAAVEQKLFDKLPAWIAALDERPMSQFDLDTGAATHTVAISRDSLLAAVSPLYPQIVQAIRQETGDGGSASLLLSHGFAGFPGLKDSLRLISGLEVIDLPETKGVMAATEHRDAIISHEGAVSHVTRLDGGEVQAPAASAAAHPTHILLDNHAYAIGQSLKLGADFPARGNDAAATLYVRGGKLMLEPGKQPPEVNGEVCAATTELRNGDALNIGGNQLTLITVARDV